MQWLAFVFSNPLTIWVVIASLLIWALVSGYRLLRGTQKLRSVLDRARGRIEQAPDELAFARDYETIAAELKEDPILGPRWHEYDDSLVLPEKPGRPIRSTTRPAQWFDLGLLRGKVDLRYQAALPNLLVGAGLLFTFAGLAAALAIAGGVVSGAPTERNAALKTLLEAASFKFLTSLAGLFLSLAYALYRKARLRVVERALDQFHEALERRVPLLTPVDLQQKTNLLLERQLVNTESFATELSMALQNTFDQAFDKRLGEHIAPLTEAMQNLASRLSNGNDDAMAKMIDAFLKKLEGKTVDHTRAVAENLEGVGKQLGGLQLSLGEAAVKMTQAAESMATRMGEGAEGALSRITVTVGGLVDSMHGMVQQTRFVGENAGRDLAERIEAITKQMQVTLHGAAAAIGDASSRSANEAAQRIADATGGMHDQFSALLKELRANAAAAGDAIHKGGSEGAIVMQAHLSKAGSELAEILKGAAESMRKAGNDAGSALQSGGKAAGTSVHEAGDAFGGRAKELAEQIAALTAAADGIGVRIAELDRATGESAGPLRSTATDLRSAGDAVRQSTAPLTQAADEIRNALSGIGALVTQITSTHEDAKRLTNEMYGTANRFSGVDRDVAETVKSLQQGLNGYTQQVAMFMKEFDNNFAKAATQLAQLIKNLQETVEDLELTQRLPSSNLPLSGARAIGNR